MKSLVMACFLFTTAVGNVRVKTGPFPAFVFWAFIHNGELTPKPGFFFFLGTERFIIRRGC